MREAVQEVRREAAFVHDVQDELLHTGVLFLDHVVRLHALADDLADAHARVQRGIRILENQLHVAAQAAHLVILESGKVDAVVAVCEFADSAAEVAASAAVLADCAAVFAA